MTPDGIMEVMRRKNLDLQEKNVQIVTLATVQANAQRDYRITIATKIAKLRLAGESVSLADTLAKGDEDVANKKVDFVIAEATYKACLESIKDTRAALDTARSLLTWQREEKYSKQI